MNSPGLKSSCILKRQGIFPSDNHPIISTQEKFSPFFFGKKHLLSSVLGFSELNII
jgi:hypothetical protein